MIICLIVLLVAAFVINPGWTMFILSQFVAYVKGNWSTFRNKKED